MNKDKGIQVTPKTQSIDRRETLAIIGSAVAATMVGAVLDPRTATAAQPSTSKEESMSPKAFVYTELQISVPFANAPWREINAAILQQPGFLNKTWLAGIVTNSLGGIYAFDSIENAQKFMTNYFPNEAKKFRVAQTTLIFDAKTTEAASRDINSVHFGAKLGRKPGAFVYTEVQVNAPFEKAPWRERNPVLKQQPGLLAKTWLSGLHTHTLGGIDAFDTVENAKAFALEAFPATAAKLNAAFCARVFDATVVEEASRQMRSPFFG